MFSFRRLIQTGRAQVQQSTVKRSFITFHSLLTNAPPVSAVNLVESSTKGVNIQWAGREEGTLDYFHGVWLRHNCHCPQCLDQDTNQITVNIAQLDDPTVTHATVNGEN